MPAIGTFKKDPDERLDYGIDWSVFLTNGDTIATSTWDVPAGITSDDDAVTANSEGVESTYALVWLSGGTEGADYGLTNRVVTAGGRTAERSITIMVRKR